MTLHLVRPPAVLALKNTPGGGFRLEGEDGSLVEATPSGDGWRIVEGGRQQRWVIRPEGSGRERVLLRAETERDEQEIGRTTAWGAPSAGGLPASLLLPDGRLFLIVVRGDDGPSFELAGWEAPGAYWKAKPDVGEWRIERTPAGRDAGLGWEALVLFAAELSPFLSRP